LYSRNWVDLSIKEWWFLLAEVVADLASLLPGQLAGPLATG
jgi:hypothetical protein